MYVHLKGQSSEIKKCGCLYRYEYGEMNITKLNQRIDDIEVGQLLTGTGNRCRDLITAARPRQLLPGPGNLCRDLITAARPGNLKKVIFQKILLPLGSK